MEQTQFQKICWHDGNIVDFRYIFPITKRDRPSIILKAEVYADPISAAYRHLIQVEFPNIQNIDKKINFPEIKDNVVAGSINYAKQKEITNKRSTFREYTFTLFGGKIKIVSNKARIVEL
jgi:hypothetical protein